MSIGSPVNISAMLTRLLLLACLFKTLVAPPTGCTYNARVARCDYTTMSFPLVSSSFPNTPCAFYIYNINGAIPSNAYSGVTDCPDPSLTDPMLKFTCTSGTTLSMDSSVFSSGQLTWLDEIVIQNCDMSPGIPSSGFSSLTGVTTLSISGGSVSGLTDSSLSTLPGLTTFTLQSNVTDATLPSGIFSSTPNLVSLSVTSAGLTSLPSGIVDGLRSLSTLDLSGNSMTTLPSNMFLELVSLTSLTLTGSAWDCVCDLSWFVQWKVYAASMVTVTKDACGTPAAYNGISMEMAILSQGCLTSNVTTVTSSTVSSSNATTDSENFTNTLLTYLGVSLGGAALLTSLASMLLVLHARNQMASLARQPSPNVAKTRITPLKTDYYHF